MTKHKNRKASQSVKNLLARVHRFEDVEFEDPRLFLLDTVNLEDDQVPPTRKVAKDQRLP